MATKKKNVVVPLRIESVRRRNLQRIRNETSLDWKELAKELGFTASYISQVMSGHRAFSEKTARKIESKLRLPHLALDSETQVTVNDSSQITDRDLLDTVKRHIAVAFAVADRRITDVGQTEYMTLVLKLYSKAKESGNVDPALVAELVMELIQE